MREMVKIKNIVVKIKTVLVAKSRRETQAHDKLMQELPSYCVPITLLFG